MVPPPITKLIALIQKEAYVANGIGLDAIQAQFDRDKQRVKNLVDQHPDYLRSQVDILAEDPSLSYVNLDLMARFDIPVPTKFQHPYLYAWLKDAWRYHCEKLYGVQHILPKELILATAPSGRFNAMALPGPEAHGILIENGLLNVIQGISNLFAFLMYTRLSPSKYQEKGVGEIEEAIQEDPIYINAIADIIYSYVVKGHSQQPAPIGDSYDEDFSIRHVLSTACWGFVFEHELYHLKVFDGEEPPMDKQFLADRYAQIWAFFQEQIKAHLPIDIDEPSFRNTYVSHQEELFADYFGLKAVFELGKKENTLPSSLYGGLLFLGIAELIEYTLFELTEPGSIQALYEASALNTSLTAIVQGQSHPYAFVRRKALGENGSSPNSPLFSLVKILNQKIDLILMAVREVLKEKLPSATAPHPKWDFGKSLHRKFISPRIKSW